MDAQGDIDNPYRPSQASLQVGQHDVIDHCWRQGDLLVTTLRAALPPQCIKCGAPARMPLKERTFQWHHRALLLVLLLNVIIYAIIAAVVRKRAVVSVGLCDAHAHRRTRSIWSAWAGVLAGLVLLVVGLGRDWPVAAVIGAVLWLSAMVFGLVAARTLLPVRIDAERAVFKGCAAAFLDGLPRR